MMVVVPLRMFTTCTGIVYVLCKSGLKGHPVRVEGAPSHNTAPGRLILLKVVINFILGCLMRSQWEGRMGGKLLKIVGKFSFKKCSEERWE